MSQKPLTNRQSAMLARQQQSAPNAAQGLARIQTGLTARQASMHRGATAAVPQASEGQKINPQQSAQLAAQQSVLASQQQQPALGGQQQQSALAVQDQIANLQAQQLAGGRKPNTSTSTVTGTTNSAMSGKRQVQRQGSMSLQAASQPRGMGFNLNELFALTIKNDYLKNEKVKKKNAAIVAPGNLKTGGNSSGTLTTGTSIIPAAASNRSDEVYNRAWVICTNEGALVKGAEPAHLYSPQLMTARQKDSQNAATALARVFYVDQPELCNGVTLADYHSKMARTFGDLGKGKYFWDVHKIQRSIEDRLNLFLLMNSPTRNRRLAEKMLPLIEEQACIRVMGSPRMCFRMNVFDHPMSPFYVIAPMVKGWKRKHIEEQMKLRDCMIRRYGFREIAREGGIPLGGWNHPCAFTDLNATLVSYASSNPNISVDMNPGNEGVRQSSHPMEGVLEITKLATVCVEWLLIYCDESKDLLREIFRQSLADVLRTASTETKCLGSVRMLVINIGKKYKQDKRSKQDKSVVTDDLGSWYTSEAAGIADQIRQAAIANLAATKNPSGEIAALSTGTTKNETKREGTTKNETKREESAPKRRKLDLSAITTSANGTEVSSTSIVTLRSKGDDGIARKEGEEVDPAEKKISVSGPDVLYYIKNSNAVAPKIEASSPLRAKKSGQSQARPTAAKTVFEERDDIERMSGISDMNGTFQNDMGVEKNAEDNENQFENDVEVELIDSNITWVEESVHSDDQDCKDYNTENDFGSLTFDEPSQEYSRSVSHDANGTTRRGNKKKIKRVSMMMDNQDEDDGTVQRKHTARRNNRNLETSEAQALLLFARPSAATMEATSSNDTPNQANRGGAPTAGSKMTPRQTIKSVMTEINLDYISCDLEYFSSKGTGSRDEEWSGVPQTTKKFVEKLDRVFHQKLVNHISDVLFSIQMDLALVHGSGGTGNSSDSADGFDFPLSLFLAEHYFPGVFRLPGDFSCTEELEMRISAKSEQSGDTWSRYCSLENAAGTFELAPDKFGIWDERLADPKKQRYSKIIVPRGAEICTPNNNSAIATIKTTNGSGNANSVNANGNSDNANNGIRRTRSSTAKASSASTPTDPKRLYPGPLLPGTQYLLRRLKLPEEDFHRRSFLRMVVHKLGFTKLQKLPPANPFGVLEQASIARNILSDTAAQACRDAGIHREFGGTITRDLAELPSYHAELPTHSGNAVSNGVPLPHRAIGASTIIGRDIPSATGAIYSFKNITDRSRSDSKSSPEKLAALAKFYSLDEREFATNYSREAIRYLQTKMERFRDNISQDVLVGNQEVDAAKGTGTGGTGTGTAGKVEIFSPKLSTISRISTVRRIGDPSNSEDMENFFQEKFLNLDYITISQRQIRRIDQTFAKKIKTITLEDFADVIKKHAHHLLTKQESKIMEKALAWELICRKDIW